MLKGLVGIFLTCLSVVATAQTNGVGLNGRYTHTTNNTDTSSFYLEKGHLTSIQATDSGAFYGKGTFMLVQHNLFLTYDTVNLSNEVRTKYTIVQPKMSILSVRKLSSHKVEIAPWQRRRDEKTTFTRYNRQPGSASRPVNTSVNTTKRYQPDTGMLLVELLELVLLFL
jgi:hypothetical protein